MLRLTEIGKQIGEFKLSGITLEIPEAEYYVLLGRSGSGKTQLLELIAGLSRPDTGSIEMDGIDITKKRIQERKIGIVFQDYAVFPHLTVEGNIAYPLRAARVEKQEMQVRIRAVSDLMNISHLLHRSTVNLSGGELQRVALARTLVTSPRLLLLDEPLSSLDASLRDDMKKILRKLHRSGQTIIHVTHDYSDAISLAGRVGVIHNGRIIQEGKVEDVFEKPVNRFVARYAGIKNFFRINVSGDGYARFLNSTETIWSFKVQTDLRDDCIAVLRSNHIKVTTEKPVEYAGNTLRGVVEEIIRTEHGFELTVKAGETFHAESVAAEIERYSIREGSSVWLSFEPESLVILDNGKSVK